MTVVVKNTSRLIHANLLTEADVEFWELPEYPTVGEREDDIFHDVEQTDRVDMLASRYYGDPTLWWVIALANGLVHLPYELVAGTRLRVPSPTYVQTELVKPR